MVRETFSVPPVWPRLYGLRPVPWPAPTGTRLRRSGNPKVVTPSPPYVVPNKLKSAVFWLIDTSCPSQSANTTDAKLGGQMRMVLRNTFLNLCWDEEAARLKFTCPSLLSLIDAT